MVLQPVLVRQEGKLVKLMRSRCQWSDQETERYLSEGKMRPAQWQEETLVRAAAMEAPV